MGNRVDGLKKEGAKKNASSVNRTRASSMATTNSTTRPTMLVVKLRSLTGYHCQVELSSSDDIFTSTKASDGRTRGLN